MLGAQSDINNKLSRIDYFLMMFPNAHNQKIIMLTNLHLSIVKIFETTVGEIKNIGVIIIATEFNFGSRRTL